MGTLPPPRPASRIGISSAWCRSPSNRFEQHISREWSSSGALALGDRLQPADAGRRTARRGTGSSSGTSPRSSGSRPLCVRSRCRLPWTPSRNPKFICDRSLFSMQRGDARLVHLERQDDQVQHQPHVVRDVLGQLLRRAAEVSGPRASAAGPPGGRRPRRVRCGARCRGSIRGTRRASGGRRGSPAAPRSRASASTSSRIVRSSRRPSASPTSRSKTRAG